MRNHLYPLLLIPFALFSACKNSSTQQTFQNELDGLKAPAGFSIERIVDPKLLSYPMFASFDEAGRLFVFESDGTTPSTEDMLVKPTYHIRLLVDANDDGIYDSTTIFADSLTYPKGGVFYKGSLYVTSSPNYLRLTDTDSNGVADKREILLTGWKLHQNGAILGGPFMGPDGWMYLTDARRGFDIINKEGKRLEGKGARIWRCRPDGSQLEPILGGGYDNAIELVFMPGGETIGTMTYFLDPQGGQRDAIMHWIEGGVYPKPHSVIDEDKLRLTGELMPVMTKLARVAPSGLMRYRGNNFGEEYEGNLFSAEFNTGRIMRHTITPQGATFKTIDEPFITATKPDVHPTDVLQDADGSMIVLNTGGWFIAGCPLSRVAKPDVAGGIYRIKRVNAKAVDDPFGKKINTTKLSADELCRLVKDERIFVRDRAIEQLVDLNNQSVPSLKTILLSDANEEIRATAVFVLGRISTENALREVRNMYSDSSAIVRTAAARVAGLSNDTHAAGSLKELIKQENLAVRRQAAIALEQLGDTTGVYALLEAAAHNNDRFAEHAIIHALLVLKNPAPLVNALSTGPVSTRRAAIIALDQMDGYVMDKENVVPFLESDDPELERTGIWVAAHHRDWGDVVVKYLSSKIAAKTDSLFNENSDFYILIVAFSENDRVQKFIADQLQNSQVNPDAKLFFLDVIRNSTVKKIPDAWVAQLRRLLSDNNIQLKYKALSIVQLRGMKELNAQLQQIISNKTTPAELKLKAFSARATYQPLLNESEFDILLQMVRSANSSTIRQQASVILASSDLNPKQLGTLAKHFSSFDNHILSSVVHAFETNANETTGKTFVNALTASASKLDNISEEDLQKILKGYPADVIKSAEPVMAEIRRKNAVRLSKLQSTEAGLAAGDIGNGRQLFFGKAICSSCHAINNEGSKFAPDLTNIGQIRSRHDILEAVMFPSASFAREHETSRIVTSTNTYTGIIREQTDEAVLVETGPGATVRVPRASISSVEPGAISLMPAGLEKQLSQQELSDLMAFLVSLPDGASGTIGY